MADPAGRAVAGGRAPTPPTAWQVWDEQIEAVAFAAIRETAAAGYNPKHVAQYACEAIGAALRRLGGHER